MKPELIVETLSDGSKVYNVAILVEGKILVGCDSRKSAEKFIASLKGVAWIKVD